MSRLARALEVGSNVGIIVTSVLMCVLVGFLVLKQKHVETRPSIQTGERLRISGIDWRSHKKTYVFALQVGCHFCADSAPEFQSIATQALKRSDIGLVAVLPQDLQAGRKYLQSLGLEVPSLQMDLSLLNVQGTPTTMMCDSQGIVRGVWRGALDVERTKDILQTIN